MLLSRRGTFIGAAIISITAIFGPVAPAAHAAPGPHGSLVPGTPARGYPIILGTPRYTTTNENCPGGCTLNREAFGADQAGRFIVAGGNFYEIELQDGSVLQQKYFAAWNIDTKQIACAGQFTFNGIIRSVEPAATPGKVYVGGDFTKVTGADGVQRTRNKVVLLNLSNCSVDNIFASIGANAKINEIVLSGSRLFVGGDFTSIGGQSIRYVAELNSTTGATIPTFKFNFGNTTLASKIRGMGVSPDGTRLLFGGRFGTVNDGIRTLNTQTVIADIGNPAAAPVLRNHTFVQTHPEYQQRPQGQSLQDVAISPDGTTFALAFGTATVSDFVYAINAVDGAQPVRWRHSMGDSSTGIAISSQAVYVLGHFCKIAAGPGTTDPMTPKMGLDVCTGRDTIPGAVWRSHLSAMSLSDGTPLAWNPGADSYFGGQEVTVTTRGLLVGFDGQRSDSVRTGALAFFDFGPGAEDATPPGTVTFTSPTAGSKVGNPVTFAGFAVDNVAIASYQLRIKRADGQWLQADGSFGATAYVFKPAARPNGSFELALSMPQANYSVEAKAVDIAGLASPTWTKVKFSRLDAEAIPPVSSIDFAPVSPAPVGAQVTVSGQATDNVSINALTAQVTNAAGLFLQNDRTFTSSPNNYPVTTGALNAPSVAWSIDLGSQLPPDSYTVALRLTDPSANIATPSAVLIVVG